MEKRIELEKRHRAPDQVTELNLDNCKGCTAVEGLTDEFVNLHTLSLIGSGLTSLKGFPKLPKLKKLELSDNKISGGLQILKDCEKLSTLNLSGNRIKDLSTLQDLKELANLRALDLYNNEVTSSEDYRNKVFELLPQLTFLDGTDRNGKEYEESDDDDEDDEDEEEENGDVKLNGKKGAVAGADAGDSDLDDEEDGEEELGEEEDSDDEVGLKDIYNDNLEDDDSDIYEEDEEEEEDHDISDEDDSALDGDGRGRLSSSLNNSALDTSSNNAQDGTAKDDATASGAGEGNASASAASEENSEDSPRGTKRKLEEEEEQELQTNLN